MWLGYGMPAAEVRMAHPIQRGLLGGQDVLLATVAPPPKYARSCDECADYEVRGGGKPRSVICPNM